MPTLSTKLLRPFTKHTINMTLLAFTCAILSGCKSTSVTNAIMGDGTTVTASAKKLMTQSGFLSDYARLKPIAGEEGIQCWRQPNLNSNNYDKILISRILLSIKPKANASAAATIDPVDLKTLTDYFHNSLANHLKSQLLVVDQTGPKVVILRVALTDLVPTTVADSLVGTAIPYGFIAEIGSGTVTGMPAGSTPYLGQTGIEMQFRDGVTNEILAECRDTEVGRKYAADINSSATEAAQTWASGYLNSFTAWSYAKDAFDKWSLLITKRIAQLQAKP